MIAYNTTWLYNKHVHEEVSEAFYNKSIDADTYKMILATKENKLYTPSFFIKVGLVILTLVGISSASGLIGLLTSAFDSIAAFCIVNAAICYAALEFFVRTKYHYNSGVDNALQVTVLVFLASAFFNYNELLFPCFSLMAVSLLIFVRFTDAFMAVVFFLFMESFLFLLLLKTGSFGKMAAPFVMMATSAIIYLTVNHLSKKKQLLFYLFSFDSIKVTALFLFYAAGNYFVVRELSNSMFDLHLTAKDGIPFGWLFWIFTVAIPIIYIGYGIRNRSLLFIRTGLILIAVIVFTVRSYYTVMPIETAMVLGGIALIVISYILIKYLQTPKHLFTFKNTVKNKEGLANIEALLIAEAFGKRIVGNNVNDVTFGGGSAGGATGTF